MTRTYVVGREPEAWQSELHGVVARAQAAATRAYLPGAPERELDAIAREAIDGAGYAEAFTHGLGHGVGLQIHEAPMIGMRSTGTLEADMTVTVEPGVYLTGRGGVRIEDTLVVTDVGPRILTQAPRDLTVVG
jgi:Xaa-Pro aminopeptidase